jgi:UDP-N-acetylmuramyl pentapeptide phosphotransferase/UDP-N-acetylglucosamine-1-phosphate transferase
MSSLLLSFFSSLLSILFVIRYQHLHSAWSADSDLSGPQKFHTLSVPRIGGLGIFFALVITGIAAWLQSLSFHRELLLLTISALPAFLLGIAEDLTKRIGASVRLLGTAISAGIAGYLLNAWISKIGISGIDQILAIHIVSICFTCFAVAGLANAYNIIDGFNGLASMIAIIALLAIAYVAFQVQDKMILYMAVVMAGAIAGFFIWNYPRGLIFLGDGGAYLIGFWVGILSILLVSRNPLVSPWFAILVNAYPIFETLFTIWRRAIHQGKNPGLPDGAHFHSLIYRRMVKWAYGSNPLPAQEALNNSKTSPYLWVISSISIIPAVLWWKRPFVLMVSALIFVGIYVALYRSVVRFKKPSWLK